jgi:hypothetical protein
MEGGSPEGAKKRCGGQAGQGGSGRTYVPRSWKKEKRKMKQEESKKTEKSGFKPPKESRPTKGL